MPGSWSPPRLTDCPLRMTQKLSVTRRTLIRAAGLAALVPAAGTLAAPRTTPRQTAGPFYPVEIPLDADADLVQVEGMSRLATGIIAHVAGQVVDTSGNPVPGTKVEIWQCDAFGAYKHPRDRGDVSEPEFQGYGFTRTSGQGEFRFRTIRPVSYPGRTPHIHARISAPGMSVLTTQFYLAGEGRNTSDFLYARVPEHLRAMVTARFPATAEESETVVPSYTVVVG